MTGHSSLTMPGYSPATLAVSYLTNKFLACEKGGIVDTILSVWVMKLGNLVKIFYINWTICNSKNSMKNIYESLFKKSSATVIHSIN